MKTEKSINQYEQIIEAYRKSGSISAVVEELHVSEVKVRRVLITEGLWSSRTSRQVSAFLAHGKTTQEIAGELNITVKAVEAYMPYRRGVYDDNSQSGSAARSEAYRRRKEAAAKKQVRQWSDSASYAAKKDLANKKEGENSMPTAEKLYTEVMEKPPRIMRLHLELVIDDMSSRPILSTYGKAKASISRDVLVPANISLHALHYVIQRGFGWQNSHLHHFEYPHDVQMSLLSGLSGELNRPSYSSWEKVCGIYFRFPTDDTADLYWDDDYEGEQSFKTWLRKKYTAPYRYDGFSEHYLESKLEAKKFRNDNPELPFTTKHSDTQTSSDGTGYQMAPIDEIPYEDMDSLHEYKLGELLERLPLIEVLFPRDATLSKGWIDQVKAVIDEAASANAKKEPRLPEYQYAIVRAAKLYEKDAGAGIKAYEQAVSEYKRFVTTTEPRAIPLSDTLFYYYDYGDGWKVSITCEKVFYTKDGWDYPNEMGYVTVSVTDKQVFNSTEVYDQGNKPITGVLRDQVAKVVTSKRPVCIAADGLDLIDDVGGIRGYCDFLLSIHEGSDEEKTEMKEWAAGQGWTGRRVKPENIL